MRSGPLIKYLHGLWCAIELRLRGILHVSRPGSAREHVHGERRLPRDELEADAGSPDHHIASHAVPLR